jgi:hypothetical protein
LSAISITVKRFDLMLLTCIWDRAEKFSVYPVSNKFIYEANNFINFMGFLKFMDLIFKGQQSGQTSQNFTEYTLPDSSTMFMIIHDFPSSYFIGFPTNTSIPKTLEIFRHIAGIEYPRNEKPLEVCIYEETIFNLMQRIEPIEREKPFIHNLYKEGDSYGSRKGHYSYHLDTDPSIIEKQLLGSSGGHVGLIFPDKGFILNAAGGKTTGFSFSSSEDKLPLYLNDVLQRAGLQLDKTELNHALGQLETKMAYFKQLYTI